MHMQGAEPSQTETLCQLIFRTLQQRRHVASLFTGCCRANLHTLPPLSPPFICSPCYACLQLPRPCCRWFAGFTLICTIFELCQSISNGRRVDVSFPFPASHSCSISAQIPVPPCSLLPEGLDCNCSCLSQRDAQLAVL